MPDIAFVGKMGSGKTTLSKLLVERSGYEWYSWADAVRATAALAYGPIRYDEMYPVTRGGVVHAITGRQVLQQLGTDAIRDRLDEDFWLKALLRDLDINHDRHYRVVIDDTRFLNEALALRARGFVLVKIKLPEDQRLRQILARYNVVEPEMLHHPSELSIDSIPCDLEIINTGTPEDTVTALMSELAKRTERTLLASRV